MISLSLSLSLSTLVNIYTEGPKQSWTFILVVEGLLACSKPLADKKGALFITPHAL
jgi:hypothetical protein